MSRNNEPKIRIIRHPPGKPSKPPSTNSQKGKGAAKVAGRALQGIAAIGSAPALFDRSLSGKEALSAVIGGMILAGIGEAIARQDGKGLNLAGSNAELKRQLTQALKEDEPIHINDLGPFSQATKRKLKRQVHLMDMDAPQQGSGIMTATNALAKHVLKHALKKQSGSGIAKDAKKLFNKGKKEFKRFIDGKTKIKPSHVVAVLATGAGAAATYAPHPAAKAALIALAIGGKMGSEALKQSGRGFTKVYPQDGSGLSLAGSGLKLAGQGAPNRNRSKYTEYEKVWDGKKAKTKGGLTKNDLMVNKSGKIVSKRRHELGKQSLKHLQKK